MLDSNLLQALKLNIINIDYCKLDCSWHYSGVKGPFSRLYLVTGGEGYIYHNNQKFHLTQGVMHLCPGFTLSSYHCDDYLEQYYIHFSDEMDGQMGIFTEDVCEYQVQTGPFESGLFKQLLALNPDKALMEYDPEKYNKKKQMIRAQQPDKKDTPATFLESKGILMLLLSRFLQRSPVTSHRQQDHSFQRLRTVIRYIDKNLEKRMSLEQLARVCHLHPNYFSKLFQKIMGVRPIEYINRKRIQKAQMLLLTTDISLNLIAQKVGLNDAAYLSRLFRKYTEQTPAQYRNQTFPR
jgi:AraC-like DNA-binding protein